MIIINIKLPLSPKLQSILPICISVTMACFSILVCQNSSNVPVYCTWPISIANDVVSFPWNTYITIIITALWQILAVSFNL